MFFSSQYWQMMTLTSAGNRQLREIESVRNQCKTLWTRELGAIATDCSEAPSLSDRKLQTYLWDRWRADKEDAALAQLALRCWLSHQIAATCNQLAAQFGQAYGFVASELWPLVLDDSDRLSSAYEPLSIKILNRYDPTQSALSTWVARMTKGHPEINRFCLERGLYRISDWAILNDTPAERLTRVLPQLSAAVLAEKTALLLAYHQVYRRDRIQQRNSHSARLGLASRCETPTEEQLRRIQPNVETNVVLSQLQELASQLREHRIAVRRKMPPTQLLGDRASDTSHRQAATNGEDKNDLAEDNFLLKYRDHFSSSLDHAIEAIALGYVKTYRRRKPPKDRLFLTALGLFHCRGLSMTAIAQQTGLTSQVQVTRLLQLKRFRTEVCACWFNQLKTQVNQDVLTYISPDRLSKISRQLEKILAEETAATIAEAAAEAQMSKNRSAKSKFARQLCAKLPALEASTK